MSRGLLAASAQAQELALGQAAESADAGHGEAAVGDSSGFVKRNDLDLAECLDRVAALEEYTQL